MSEANNSDINLDWLSDGCKKTRKLSSYDRYVLYLFYLGRTHKKVAKMLKIDRTTLWRKINKLTELLNS